MVSGAITVSRGSSVFASLTLTLALLLGSATPARAYEIDFVFHGSLDLPRVNVMFMDESGEPYRDDLWLASLFADLGIDMGDWLGLGDLGGIGDINDLLPGLGALVPGFYDTGASGMVLGGAHAAALGLPLEPDVVFEDIGVGGTVKFDVTQPLDIRVVRHNLGPYSVGGGELAQLQALMDPAGYANTHAIAFPDARIAVGPRRNATEFLDELDELLARLSEVNVFGMPLFEGQVAVMDVRPLNSFARAWSDFDPENDDVMDLLGESMHVTTSLYDASTADTNPAIPTPDVRIRTSFASFSDYVRTFREEDGVQTDLDLGEWGPDLRANPFIGPNPILTQVEEDFSDDTPGITITRGASQATGSWLFDTGAAASMISSEQAGNIGVFYAEGHDPGSDQTPLLVDDNGQPIADQFFLTVQGIAGVVQIGGFWLDGLMVPTVEGDEDPDKNLYYGQVPVLVLDIWVERADGEAAVLLDGIFGMNLLFPSIYVQEPIDQLGLADAPVLPGLFDFVTFNEETGIVGLTFVPEPSSVALMLTGGALVLLRRRRV